MNKKIYLEKLDELTEHFESIPDTAMGMYFKVANLIVLNMRYEKVAFDRELREHPYLIVKKLITEQLQSFRMCVDTLFIENLDNKDISFITHKIESRHHSLWNALWNKYDKTSFEERVNRFKYRLRLNQLDKVVRGKTCLDLGSGNGAFSIALAELGAKSVKGIDFSEESIEFANKVLESRECKNKIRFNVASVYNLPYQDNSFDFIIQNGVFHHLEDESKAIEEVRRVLKAGGYFWYYTSGEGGISYSLWDSSAYLLRNTPIEFIQQIMRNMNISVNKSYHLGDGLKATYKRTSWEKITKLLRSKGFDDFKRLEGGFYTDLDGDTVKLDSYAKEKFGEGDLRILARLKIKE